MAPTSSIRTFLFVPADSPRKIEHALHSNADALVFDWEDSIPPAQKQQAREHCLALAPLSRRKAAVFIRVNSASSPWFLDDIKAAARIRPDGMMLPKCQSAQEVHDLAEALLREDAPQNLSICPMIESPLGLLRIEEIAQSSCQVAALCFGSHDFRSSAGIRPTPGEPELLLARSTIVTVARAFDLAAIDSPALELNDLQAVRDDVGRSANLGFTGKFAIHPAHLQLVAEAFTPTPDEVKQAEEILREASIREQGAFAWKGEMVDEAILKRARRILERAHPGPES